MSEKWQFFLTTDETALPNDLCDVVYFKVKTVALRADRKWIAQIDVWSFYEHWVRASSPEDAQCLVHTCQHELGSVKLTEKDHFINVNYFRLYKRRVTKREYKLHVSCLSFFGSVQRKDSEYVGQDAYLKSPGLGDLREV